jgi:hypothetical protein
VGRLLLRFASRLRIGGGYAKELRLPAIASADHIRNVLRHRCAAVDTLDPTWVVVNDPALFAEVSIASERPDGLMFFVRGGTSPGPLISVIASDLACRAFDCSSGDWLDGGEGGYAAWTQYRDQVVRDS